MKFTTAILALAATAVAVPTGGGGGNIDCSNHGDQSHPVCCSRDLLGVLKCVLQLGGNCNQQSFCCKNAPQPGMINIDILGCAKVL